MQAVHPHADPRTDHRADHRTDPSTDPHASHDFRSDTVTLPTPQMMAAIASARLGDAARGGDPTVNELEALCADLTGKADALFVPSGVMANLAALMAHECRGGEVIVEAASHLYNAEGGGLSVIGGAVARPVVGDGGILDAARVRRAIRTSADPALAPTRLICLENTHNAAGGVVTPVETLAAIHAVAQRAGIPVHLDGARLFNAASYLKLPISSLCAHVDSVWFALCKGLGGPVGAVLAGDKAFMQRARRAARLLGGGMRQAGLIAAPALVALRGDAYAAHRRDHALAKKLAAGLAGIDASLVEVDRVQTNIVNCSVDAFADDATEIARGLRQRGVLTSSKPDKIRFVTHAQVNDASVDAAIQALAEILQRRSSS